MFCLNGVGKNAMEIKDNNGWISFEDEMPHSSEYIAVTWEGSISTITGTMENLPSILAGLRDKPTHWRRIELPEVGDES